MLTTAESPTQKRMLHEAIMHTLLSQLALQSKEREMRSDERTFAADTADLIASSPTVKVYGCLDVAAIATALTERFTTVQVQREKIFSRFLQEMGSA